MPALPTCFATPPNGGCHAADGTDTLRMEVADPVIQHTRKPIALALLGLVLTSGCSAPSASTSTQKTTVVRATASGLIGGQAVASSSANAADPQKSPVQGTRSSLSSHPSAPFQPSLGTKSSLDLSSSVRASPPQSAPAVKPVSSTSAWTWKSGQEQYDNQAYVPLTLALHMNPPSSKGYKVGTPLDFAITLADDGDAPVTLSEPLALAVQVQRLNKGVPGSVLWEGVLPSAPTTIGIGTINVSWKQTDSAGQALDPGTYQASLKTPITVNYTMAGKSGAETFSGIGSPIDGETFATIFQITG